MSTDKYIYVPAVEPLTEVWFKKLESENQYEDYGGDLYWLTQGSDGQTLLELSTCRTKYRYVWWNGKADRSFDTGCGTQPSPKWLNPEALVYRDKQPLPFQWRS